MLARWRHPIGGNFEEVSLVDRGYSRDPSCNATKQRLITQQGKLVTQGGPLSPLGPLLCMRRKPWLNKKVGGFSRLVRQVGRWSYLPRDSRPAKCPFWGLPTLPIALHPIGKVRSCPFRMRMRNLAAFAAPECLPLDSVIGDDG